MYKLIMPTFSNVIQLLPETYCAPFMKLLRSCGSTKDTET